MDIHKECVNKYCKEFKEPVYNFIIKYKTKLCKLIPKIKTVKEIDEDYKKFKQIKKDSVRIKLKKCVKQHCIIDINKLINIMKVSILSHIYTIKENKYSKYPFWDKLENKLNKLLEKPNSNINDNDKMKLSYYILFLSCIVLN